METKYCVFCSDIRQEMRKTDESSEYRGSHALKRFIVWIQRHFGIPAESSSFIEINRRNGVTHLELEPCERCLNIVVSFNEMYKELKCLELEIQLQMNTLMEIMKTAGKAGPRQRPSMKALGKREFRKLSRERNEWIEKCSDQLLVNGFPKIKLEYINPVTNKSAILSGRSRITTQKERKSTKAVNSKKAPASEPVSGAKIKNEKVSECGADCGAEGIDFEIDSDPMNIYAENETICVSLNDTQTTEDKPDTLANIKTEPRNTRGKPMSVHKQKSPYYCQICRKSLTTYTNYRNHLKTLCHRRVQKTGRRDDPSFTGTCGVCGLEFFKKQEFRRHQVKHRKNSFSCSLCDTWFLRKDYFTRHMRINHGAADNRNRAKKSTMSTPKEKPFKCYICDQRFSHDRSIKRHVDQIHRGQRDFKCAVKGCGAAFPRNEVLKRHILIMHGDGD